MEELLAPPFNFLGLSEEYSNYDNARFVILPVPYDATTTYMPGTRFGPEAIISASRNIELYDEEMNLETFKQGIHTFSPVAVSSSGPEQTLKNIRDVASEIIKANKFLVTIGGEHSITYPVVNAIKSVKKNNFAVLQFDAHSDFRNEYEGTIFSHACVMHRISDLNIPVFQVGIRSVCIEELPILKKDKVTTFWMKDIVESSVELIASQLIKKLPQNIYITIDIDVLDPSIMPSTGTPEPGGMLWYQILKVLRMVMLSKNVIGMDVVELAPIPGLAAPNFLTAKLIYRCMGYLAKNTSAKNK